MKVLVIRFCIRCAENRENLSEVRIEGNIVISPSESEIPCPVDVPVSFVNHVKVVVSAFNWVCVLFGSYGKNIDQP